MPLKLINNSTPKIYYINFIIIYLIMYLINTLLFLNSQLTILININISPIKFNERGKEKFIIQNKNHHIITVNFSLYLYLKITTASS